MIALQNNTGQIWLFQTCETRSDRVKVTLFATPEVHNVCTGHWREIGRATAQFDRLMNAGYEPIEVPATIAAMYSPR